MTETQVKQNRYNQAQNIVPAAMVSVVDKAPASIPDPSVGNASPVQFVVRHKITPESRAQALVVKTHCVTVFLALMTGSIMYILQLYPLHWATLAIFMLWLGLASLEWLAAFCLLAKLNWRETPLAIEWHRTNGMLDLMRREQKARLMKMYGLTVDEVKEMDR